MKHKGKAAIIMGLLLIAAALFLIAYNLYDGWRASEAAKRTLKQLSSEMQDAPAGTEPVIPDYMLDPDMDMPVKMVNGIDYVGVLKIPSLELELPVISHWSYSGLKSAPCRYAGSVYLNNMVLCAHNYSSHFGRLKNLQEGDAVIFTDMDGNVFTYETAVLETLYPMDIEEMESGDWDLTLFTCTVGGASRVTVRCELAGEEPAFDIQKDLER